MYAHVYIRMCMSMLPGITMQKFTFGVERRLAAIIENSLDNRYATLQVFSDS